MKIITYNVNGLRAAVGKGLPEWLAQEQPDVLCLQETKLQPEQYPAEAFEALGYKAWLFSAQKKGYSGVAILSRREPDHVEYGMGIEKYDNEGRFIRADFGDLSVISVYHPSGTSGDERQAFKMEWLEDFQNYVVELQKSRPKLILCGRAGMDDSFPGCRLYRHVPPPQSGQTGIYLVELSFQCPCQKQGLAY